jgi:hypothetical protein
VLRFPLVLFLLLLAFPAGACFGPKLYVGTPAGEDGELLFYLVAIYIKEKTGVESLRVELAEEQAGEKFLQQDKVDLVFHSAASADWKALLQLEQQLWLLSGPRPTQDLQFTTVPRALSKLQRLLTVAELSELRRQVAAGVLPAKVVRTRYMERGWI